MTTTVSDLKYFIKSVAKNSATLYSGINPELSMSHKIARPFYKCYITKSEEKATQRPSADAPISKPKTKSPITQTNYLMNAYNEKLENNFEINSAMQKTKLTSSRNRATLFTAGDKAATSKSSLSQRNREKQQSYKNYSSVNRASVYGSQSAAAANWESKVINGFEDAARVFGAVSDIEDAIIFNKTPETRVMGNVKRGGFEEVIDDLDEMDYSSQAGYSDVMFGTNHEITSQTPLHDVVGYVHGAGVGLATYIITLEATAGVRLAVGISEASLQALRERGFWSWKDEQTLYHTVTSVRSGQGILEEINPEFFNPNTRFGEAFYLSEVPDTTLSELAYHDAMGVNTIRFNFNNKLANFLDLANLKVAKQWGYSGGNDYSISQNIAERARQCGFDVIRYPSERGLGSNLAIFNNFQRLLTPRMIVPAEEFSPQISNYLRKEIR